MKNVFKRAALAATLLACTAAAQAEVVVVMSARSSVNSLSKAQVSQIFLAKSAALPDGSRAIPLDQTDGSAVRNDFYNRVAGKDAAQMRAYWSQLMFTGKAQRPKQLASDAAVVQAVAASPGTIGYVNASAVNSSVKVVLKP